jgi:hypothetical protein
MSRTFKLIRDEDVSFVSGTGFICEGVVFSDGHVALHWLGEMPTTTPMPTLEWVLKIHGHEGKTRLVWDDETGPQQGFNEKDISYLHEILSDDKMAIWHLGARRLLKKLRAAMGKAAIDILESLS